jgi:PAS domain S-box-containing protein
MPKFTTLDFILFIYFLGATIVIIIFAYFLEKSKKKIQTLTDANYELCNRLRLFQSQLGLIQQKNQTYHNTSEMETVFNQIDLGIIILSSQSTIISINPYAERLFGIKKMEVLTKSFNDYVKLVDSENKPDTKTLNRALSGNTTPLPIWTFCLIGNEKVPLVGEFTPLYNTGGIKQVLFHFFTNNYLYSENQNLQNELNQKSINYTELKRTIDLSSKLLNRLALAVIILNSKGNVIQVNPFAEKLLGVFKSDVLAKNYQEIIITKNAKGIIDYSCVESALNEKETQFSKWTLVTTRTGMKAISGAAVPLSNDQGDKYVCIYFIDMTHEYLDETEEKAFFSSVAHDLRSPLTTIRGVTEVLESSFDKMPTPQVKELLTGAKESAIHLINLVNDLLNVSRIDLGRIEINKTVFNLVTLTRDIVNNMQINTKNRKLYLKYDVTDTDIPKAFGDENKTIDIITNLISNAIKYTHSGGITITQKYEEGYIATFIEDTGVGIAPENINLLFKKFQQVGASRNQPMTKSTGLGLYIAKKLAILMGGDIILVKSELEKGSTFKFVLPIAHE